ncbi:MAG: HlyD family efflux transporter periplasmic adaptor subunit [Pirellulales bacterium]|nr:HlyD family efflux transporter periplasmic adaptor subunit [Pirellulales bacterium]
MSRSIIVGGVAVGAVIIVVVVFAVVLAGRTPVESAQVSRADIREYVEEQGTTRLPREFEITMPFAARVDSILLKEGDPVGKGEIVAQLNRFDLDNDVAVAQAAVDRLTAAIAESGDKTVETTGYEQTQSYVESMDLTVQAADEQRRSAKKKLDVALNQLNRIKEAYEANPRSVTLDIFEQAELTHIEAEVSYTQTELIYNSLQAIQSATKLLPTAVMQYIARKDLTTAVREREQAEAQARLDMATVRRERGRLTSPVDGVVLHREIIDEQFLPAGQRLLTIGRLEEMEVEADILSQDVVDVDIGDGVELFGPTIGATPVLGTVKRIYPAGFTKISSLGVEQQRVRVIVTISSEHLQQLRDQQKLGVGYRVRVRIYTSQKSNAQVIPRSALFRSMAGVWQVFAIRDGVTSLQPVKVGLMNDESVEILEGLNPEDHVVLAPETTLEEGTRVTENIRGQD